MADRVAVLASEGRRKRKAAVCSSPLSPAVEAPGAAQQMARLDAKAAAIGKLPRTDTETVDEQFTTGTQDSVQSAFDHCHVAAAAAAAVHQQQHQAQQAQQAQQQQRCPSPAAPQPQEPEQPLPQQQPRQQRHGEAEEGDGGSGSGSEVEGPVNDKYIKGTRLVIGGWFQACRGCNEPTAHSAVICRRDVPLCPRCQGKYNSMVGGCYPPSAAAPQPGVEPLHYWLPRLLAAVPRLTDAQRREFCDRLVLRQDDAWLQLINMS